MPKIIGNTTATPNPRPDWNQTDETKADYIKNKPELGELASKDKVEKNDFSDEVLAAIDFSNYSTTEEMNSAIATKAEEILLEAQQDIDAVQERLNTHTSDHAPSNAQENVIECIQINGLDQSVNNKTVNLTVPTTPEEIGAAPSVHNHDDAYDKKGASTEALTSAQAYTDSVTTSIKNDLTDEFQGIVEEESIRAQSVENLIKTMLANKVDKVAGKMLSSNDFTIEEKMKLASLTAFSVDNELSDISENTVQNKVITQALLTKQNKISGGIRQIAGFDVSGNLVARDFTSLDEVLGVNEVNEICGLLAYITQPNEWGTTVIAKRFRYSENDYGTTVII